MGVLTESELRRTLRNKDLDSIREFEVTKKQIITPSAMSFLNEHNITLKYKNTSEIIESDNIVIEEVADRKHISVKKIKYRTILGIELDYKPEYMTKLYDDILVFKDDKRIVFRGKMDSLEAEILKAQLLCKKEHLPKLVNDLDEILIFIRRIIISEISRELLPDVYLQDMDDGEIKEKAANPKKYFGIDDEPLNYTMGEIALMINGLKTKIRETEIAAYVAFKEEYGGVKREDIVKALNRLSSLFNIMIFKYKTGKYSS